MNFLSQMMGKQAPEQTPPDVRGNTAGFAAMALKYRPAWQQEFADGTTDLQFEQWLQQKMGPGQNPDQMTMPPSNVLAPPAPRY